MSLSHQLHLSLQLLLLLVSILPAVVASKEDEGPIKIISSSPHIELNLSLQNSTFILSKQLFVHDKETTSSCSSFSIEMELSDDRDVYENLQVAFGVNSGSAIKLNQDTLSGDYIDARGYFLRKKYFRTDSISSAYLSQSLPLYLTIIKNSYNIPALPIDFTLRVIPFNSCSDDKRCPFNCSKSGTCDGTTGRCLCRRGFFDTDCSRIATSLTLFKDVSHQPNEFSWQSRFYNSHKMSFYYIPRSKITYDGGYMYLDITSETDLSKKGVGNLEIFYTTSPYQGDEDSSTINSAMIQRKIIFSQQQLAKGVQVFLDMIRSKERSEEIDEEDAREVDYMIGFYQYDEGKEAQEFEANYFLKLYTSKTDLSNNQSFLGKEAVVIVLCVILLILILMLIGLLAYLRTRTRAIDARLERINQKKMKRMEEEKVLLELIPAVSFTEELKNELKKISEGDHQEDPSCSVCLCEFECGDSVRRTYCPHYFHADCLESWLRKQKNCPHCRNSMSPRSIICHSSKGFVSLPKQVSNPFIKTERKDINQLHHKGSNYILQIDDDTHTDNTNNSPVWQTNSEIGQSSTLTDVRQVPVLSGKSKFSNAKKSTSLDIGEDDEQQEEGQAEAVEAAEDMENSVSRKQNTTEAGEMTLRKTKHIENGRSDSTYGFIDKQQQQKELQVQEDKNTIQEIQEVISNFSSQVKAAAAAKSLQQSPLKKKQNSMSPRKKTTMSGQQSFNLIISKSNNPRQNSYTEYTEMSPNKKQSNRMYLSQIFKEEKSLDDVDK